MRVPSSTPAGVLTERGRARVTRPAPPHAGQGSSMTSPRPWQVGQVRSIEKKPCVARTRPWPAQVGHCRGFDPDLAPEPEHASHVTEVGILIVAALPLKASVSSISML